MIDAMTPDPAGQPIPGAPGRYMWGGCGETFIASDTDDFGTTRDWEAVCTSNFACHDCLDASYRAERQAQGLPEPPVARPFDPDELPF